MTTLDCVKPAHVELATKVEDIERSMAKASVVEVWRGDSR